MNNHLIPRPHYALLLENGRDRDKDHPPVVKLFTPDGNCTWLLCEVDEDGDTAFGLCDLGMGCPELGNVSLMELHSARGKLGLPIERDRYFTARHPISVYAKKARELGRIAA